jgi:uncharacterized protein with GYD domain
MDRRALISGSVLLGAAFVSGIGSAEDQEPSLGEANRKESTRMPSFLVTGHFRDKVIRNIGKTGVAAQRDALNGIAKKLKGQLSKFYLVGGTWRMIAIFELSGEASSQLVYRLLASGLFESDFRLGRILTSAEADHPLGSLGKAGQPWIGKPM